MTTAQIEVLAPEPATRRRAVLVVDDEPGIRDSLSLFLEGQELDVAQAENGEQALKMIGQRPFPLVISDISMPGRTDGLELLHFVNRHCPETAVILMTGHLDIDYAIQALKHGAFDYFKKPFLFDEVRHSIERAFEHRELRVRSREFERLKQRKETMRELHTQFMVTLAAMIDAKSRFTRTHSERVSGYACYLAKELGLSAKEVLRITIGGKLHDVGKIGMPEEILNKQGPLSEDEWAVVRRHPVLGAELLKPISFLEPYLPIVRWHHENWDGTGYPDGLRGSAIPLDVLIVKIADYYDAITSHRPYREPMNFRQAVVTLEREISRAFPEDLVHAFLSMLKKTPWERSGG